MRLSKLFTSSLLATVIASSAQAQFPSGVKEINAVPNQVTTVSGDLSEGKQMENLRWASTSSNACFPGTQNSKFTGNHVLHGFKIPPYSEVTITVIPNSKKANFSLYGYQVGANNYQVAPDLRSCVSCEADHKWDYPKKGKTQDHTRSIFFNSVQNPYNIFIGVTGADGLAKGAYTLQVDLKSKVITPASEQQPLKVYDAPSKKGESVTYAGDLADGCPLVNLDWADNSSVACFPGTQNKKFNGNHVFYVTEIPPRSEMTITVIPADKKANMSIYAYEVGTTSNAMPPNLSSCVTCEAEHKWDYPKRGKTQDHTRSVYLNAINNPYKVVIGIAGADGLNTGKFKVQIDLK